MPGEIVTVIITVVGLVIFLLNQALEGNDQQQQQRPQRPGQDPRRPQQPRDEEVNSFLREVAQRRTTRAEPRREPPPLPEPRQSSGSTFGSSISERSSDFSERVASDVSTHDVDSKIDDHIAETFKPHHAPLQSSLAGRYSGSSGTSGAMGAGSIGSVSSQSSPGFLLDFPGLVGDPQALQKAIILQTIMQRPEDNWNR